MGKPNKEEVKIDTTGLDPVDIGEEVELTDTTEDLTAKLKGINADAAKTTENFNGEDVKKTAEPEKKKSLPSCTDETVRFLNGLTTVTDDANKSFDNTVDETLAKGMADNARIVGYITRTGPKTDFVRKTTVAKDPIDKKTAISATYSFRLKQTAPARPRNVLVKVPQDLLDLQKKNKGIIKDHNGITIDGALAKATINKIEEGDVPYILMSLSTKNTELSDFCIEYSNCYIQEDKKIFDPYCKVKIKDKVAVVEERKAYENLDCYAPTGYKPGIMAQYKSKVKTSKDRKLDSYKVNGQFNVTAKDDYEIVRVFTHTGRNTWVTPFNYIADKTYQSITPTAPTKVEEANEMSKLYFARYFDDSTGEIKKPKAYAAIAFTEAEGFEGFCKVVSGVYTSTPFAVNSEYWATATVEDWYEVDTVNKTKKKLAGSEIKLAKREIKTNKNGETVVYVADQISNEPSAPRYFPNEIPLKVQQALGGLKDAFDYKMYTHGMSSSSSSKGSGITRDLTVKGKSFLGLTELLKMGRK